MELSTYLAQLFGLYFIIAGIIVAWRQRPLMEAMSNMSSNRGVLMAVAFVELVAGLAVLLAHWEWTFDWRGLITFIGAWMVVEAVIYMALPTTSVKNLIRHFNRPPWYSFGSLIAVIVGTYLAGFGFGFFS